jgi:hypothetical protein
MLQAGIKFGASECEVDSIVVPPVQYHWELCIDIIKTLFYVGQGVNSIIVEPSLCEEQLSDTNEAQLCCSKQPNYSE